MWRIPLVAVLLVAGCGAQIGDACTNNIDCSPLGDRFCDTASLRGYCTKEDCGPTTCPGDSVCIRFFSPLQNEPCIFNPVIPFSRSGCPNVDDRCVCDTSNDAAVCDCPAGGTKDANGICSVNNAHCAPSATERHWCQRSCGDNGDCRDGYECRTTGTFGAEAIPTFSNGWGTPAKFCAPQPMPF